MPDIAGSIITRIRAVGANVEIDGGKLHIVNGRRVPDDLRADLRRNGKAVAEWLDHEGAVEERAAIIQFDGHTPREWVDQFAQFCISHRPRGVSDLDWSWFITRCGQIVDEAPRAA
jgi:hypothetical protein